MEAFGLGSLLTMAAAWEISCALTPVDMVTAAKMALVGIAWMAVGLGCMGPSIAEGASVGVANILLSSGLLSLIIQNVAAEVSGGAVAGKTLARNCVVGLIAYDFTLWAYLVDTTYATSSQPNGG